MIDYKEVEKQLSNIPTKKKVIARLKEIEKIKWFQPIEKIDKPAIEKQVKKIYSAFKLDLKVDVEIKILKTPKEWDLAWDSAWDSAWEVVSDLEKKKGYKTNPFHELIKLWKQGFYVCGVVDGNFILYYVPKKVE